MDAHALLAYARRRWEADPDTCPIELHDAALLLAHLAALEGEAELEEAELAEELAAAREAKKREMALGFRRASGSKASASNAAPVEPAQKTEEK
jgi:hypothetical protein